MKRTSQPCVECRRAGLNLVVMDLMKWKMVLLVPPVWSSGMVIQSAYSHLIGCADALEAETLACLHGLTMLLQCCEKPIMVESYCSCLVDAIKAGNARIARRLHTSSLRSYVK
jgi:hypothetical protein